MHTRSPPPLPTHTQTHAHAHTDTTPHKGSCRMQLHVIDHLRTLNAGGGLPSGLLTSIAPVYISIHTGSTSIVILECRVGAPLKHLKCSMYPGLTPCCGLCRCGKCNGVTPVRQTEKNTAHALTLYTLHRHTYSSS
jgi:hypothetical protein